MVSHVSNHHMVYEYVGFYKLQRKMEDVTVM
jgi:hypothetical protein